MTPWIIFALVLLLAFAGQDALASTVAIMGGIGWIVYSDNRERES